MSLLNITVLTRSDDLVRVKQSALALAVLLACVSWGANAATFPLGSAGSFGALAHETVTCTGAGAITGDIGVSPGSAVVGFPPCSLTGILHVTDSAAGSGIADAGTAFTALAGLAPDADMSGVNLGGLTLPPGVYKFTSGGQLTGGLTLDGQGQIDPLFVFQFVSGLVIDSGASVTLINGAVASNVFFQVGTSATLNTTSNIAGTIIAGASVSMATGAVLNGRALALAGEVTLDGNAVVVPGAGPPAPPPPPPPPGNSPPSGLLTILGELCEGKELTANSTITDTDGLGPFTYQWFVNNVPVNGTNSITFVPDARAAGQFVRVEVSYIDGSGHEEHVSSSEVGPICRQKQVFFVNPAENPNQQTFLRIVNPNAVSNVVDIVGHDDSGASGLEARMSLAIPARSTVQLNAGDLELGNIDKGLTGRLGDGVGKWQLKLSSPEEIVVMSLIRTPDGFLTSVSETAPRSGADEHILVIANPVDNQIQQSFIRIVNPTASTGDVFVSAIDDAGMPAPGGDLQFALGPFESLNFNSLDYTLGNLSKGLVGALGEGTGKWHFTVRSALEVAVMGLIRTPDGFVTNLSHVAPRATLDPSSDRSLMRMNLAESANQQSVIRLINHLAAPATVVLSGIDDDGAHAHDTVFLTLPPHGAKQVLASDLESGNPGAGVFSNFGAFGLGTGHWQVTLSQSEDSEVDAQSLMRVPGDFLTNISGTVNQTSPLQANVWIVNPASNTDQLSVLRIVNRSESAGAVLIEAIDDSGLDAPGGSVALALTPRAAIELTAQDLEQGNPSKGLVGALGDGTGKWRIILSADVSIQAQSLLSTPSGFLTDLSRVVE